MTVALPDHLSELNHRLRQLERQRILYTLLGIGVTFAILYFGIVLAEQHNAGSFSRGIENFFDYPRDMLNEAAEAGRRQAPEFFAAFRELHQNVFIPIIFLFALLCVLSYLPFLKPVARLAKVLQPLPEICLILAVLVVAEADPIPAFVEVMASTANLSEKYLPELLSTINMAVFSTFVGFVFATILSFFASANLIKNGWIVQTTRRFLDLARSFPELVIAMVFLYLMGKSELPAVIAIAIHTTGALGKLFSEAVENIDPKPLDGLQSAGGGWVKRVRFGVLPQVLPLFFSYALLRLEINVRASTILGFVGAGGIGEALSTVIQWRYGADIIAIMVMLILTITALDYFSSYLRGRLIGDRA